MYTYNQKTGILTDAAGEVIGHGYSGFNVGKNNPDWQGIADTGPIPRGVWSIGEAFNSPDHGPLAIHLAPIAGTCTFGRSGFLMHGDSLTHPGYASRGCIIMPHTTRELVANGTDRTLQVV